VDRGLRVHTLHHRAPPTPPFPPPPSSPAAVGRSNQNVVPCPATLSTCNSDPCAPISPCAIASPSPVPLRGDSGERQYHSNTCGNSSAGIPDPVSWTTNRIDSSCPRLPAASTSILCTLR